MYAPPCPERLERQPNTTLVTTAVGLTKQDAARGRAAVPRYERDGRDWLSIVLWVTAALSMLLAGVMAADPDQWRSVIYAALVLATSTAVPAVLRLRRRHGIALTPDTLNRLRRHRDSQIADLQSELSGVYQMMDAVCEKFGIEVTAADAPTKPIPLYAVRDRAS